MDKLKHLLSLCKCGVFVSVNGHRDYYETVQEYLGDRADATSIDDDVRAKMIETNTVIEVQFYPHTPVGSYVVWHYDLDAALDESLACLK